MTSSPLSMPSAFQAQEQCIGAAADADGMLYAIDGGKLGLDLIDFEPRVKSPRRTTSRILVQITS